VRFGSYSQTRIFQHGIAYDEKTPGLIPLRVLMVRGAILWSMVRVRPGATLRMATAKWDGMDVVCALLSGDEQASATPGRRWEEREYCVDPKAGLLRVYSEAPGIYTVYDYSDALQFHGRSFARHITIVEHGEAVLNIQLDALADPAAPDPSWFTPTRQMMAGGPGVILTPPVRFTELVGSPSGYGGIVQPVIIHASIDPHGMVQEAEPLQYSDLNLSNAAVSLVRHAAYSPSDGQVPTQKEAFIEVQFGAAR